MFELFVMLTVLGVSFPWLARAMVGARRALAWAAAIPLVNVTLAFVGSQAIETATGDGSDALMLWVGAMVFASPLVIQAPSLLLFMFTYRAELRGRLPSSAVKRWRKQRG